jgi:hypothetical protein
MNRSARRPLALASLAALVLVASGLEIRCDGANAQSRTTIASLQAEIDLLGLRVAMLEASASGYQLKGFSSTNRNGNSGVLAMNSACAATFTGSRMCTSSEVLETTNVPVISSNADAWVRPSFSPVASGSTAATVGLDASGVPSPNASNGNTSEDLSCRGWAASSGLGLAVNKNGSFRLSACDGGRPVACCGP